MDNPEAKLGISNPPQIPNFTFLDFLEFYQFFLVCHYI